MTSKILAIYQKTAVISTEYKLLIRDTGQSVLQFSDSMQQMDAGSDHRIVNMADAVSKCQVH